MLNTRYEIVNNEIRIELMGRLDIGAIERAEKDINSYLEGNEYEIIVFDLEELEYISSAGLRLILKYKKQHNDTVIINANANVYDVFSMTGFTEIMSIEKAFRKIEVDGLEVIGEGARGIVYRYNEDTIVKVSKTKGGLDGIKREKQLAKKAFVMGVPTAISFDVIKVHKKYGSMFELLDCNSLSKEINNKIDNLDKAVDIYTDLLKTIHNIKVDDEEIPSVKLMVNSWIDSLNGFVSDDLFKKIKDFFDSIPDTNNLLHMDFHVNNVMLPNGEATLIDMDSLSKGNPIIEIGNIYSYHEGFLLIDIPNVESFLSMDQELSKEFFKRFFNKYYEDLAEDEKKEMYRKVRLIGLIKALRHLAKRIDRYPNYKEIRDNIVNIVNELI